MQTSKRIDYIKKWILDYCKSMPKEPNSLVIGISGGIDSSVTSTICALTGKKTIVLSMPIKQIKEQHDLSLKHKNWLKEKFKNIEDHLINLDLLFETFKHSLSKFNNAIVHYRNFFGRMWVCIDLIWNTVCCPSDMSNTQRSNWRAFE